MSSYKKSQSYKEFLKSLKAILKDRCEEVLDKYGCVKTDKALPKSWASEYTDRRFNLSGADAAYQDFINANELNLSGTNKKFSCPESQALISTYFMFPENTTIDVNDVEELVITIDDEEVCSVGVYLLQSF